MLARHFTLPEILIVCVILLLSSAIVLPRLMLSSRRMQQEEVFRLIRQAFAETRARACAEKKVYSLKAEGESLLVEAAELSLPNDWIPPAPEETEDDGISEESPASPRSFLLPATNEYSLPSGLSWEEPELSPTANAGEEENPLTWYFFPDGQASGPHCHFSFQNLSYSLVLNPLTGSVELQEANGEANTESPQTFSP